VRDRLAGLATWRRYSGRTLEGTGMQEPSSQVTTCLHLPTRAYHDASPPISLLKRREMGTTRARFSRLLIDFFPQLPCKTLASDEFGACHTRILHRLWPLTHTLHLPPGAFVSTYSLLLLVQYCKRRMTIRKRSANTTQCALVSSILGFDLRGFCASDAYAGQNCASEPSGGRRIRLQGLRSPTLRLKFARQWPHWLQFHQPPEPQCSIKLCTSSLLISLNTSSYNRASSSFVH